MLALSTEAAPQLTLDALATACSARGVGGVEIVIGPTDDVDTVLARARASTARVVALRVSHVDATSAPAIARCSAALGVPVSVPPFALPLVRLAELAPVFARAGGRLLLGCHGDLDEARLVIEAIAAVPQRAALGLAWEIRPATDHLADASAMLFATIEHLGAVRLYGGGPEQRDQDGRGVGPLFVELALLGFTGPIILSPSTPALLPRWSDWLASRGSSGCGHAVSTRAIELDVRDVEPRDRLATIMGAYRQLVPGVTLHLTVDHDPVCMYYQLEATEPANSFAFEIVERGPEVWRAEVTKR